MNAEQGCGGHSIAGSPREQLRAVIAKHLCGWIGGHGVIDSAHFIADADLILADVDRAGLEVVARGVTDTAAHVVPNPNPTWSDYQVRPQ